MKILKLALANEILTSIPPYNDLFTLPYYKLPIELINQLRFRNDYSLNSNIIEGKELFTTGRYGHYIHSEGNYEIIRKYLEEKVDYLKEIIPFSSIEPQLIDFEFVKVIFPFLENQISGKYVKSFIFKEDIYFLSTNSFEEALYSVSQFRLLILEFFDKDRRKWEKLNRVYSQKECNNEKYVRARIPEEVRIAVWRRDDGKCARCGSREKIEYDHIVPVSRGGSNTARNIELLCEKCNRQKSNNIS